MYIKMVAINVYLTVEKVDLNFRAHKSIHFQKFKKLTEEKKSMRV